MAQDPYRDMIKAAQGPAEHLTKVARVIEKNMKKSGFKKR
jgi:hypothetical protein